MVFIASSYHRLGTSEESSRSSSPLGRDSSSFPDSLLRDVALEKAGWKWLLLFLPLRPSSFSRQECLQERTAWERESGEREGTVRAREGSTGLLLSLSLIRVTVRFPISARETCSFPPLCLSVHRACQICPERDITFAGLEFF